MGHILVTGFTGNVGQEVAKSLWRIQANYVCAVRNVEKAIRDYGDRYTYTSLDFNRVETFDQALEGVDRIFLNYPPETPFPDFHAFIDRAKAKGVRHITYLSVKDVQFLPFVPHHKNERAIVRSGIPYTFLRAGYFTQNLNMFLLDELLHKDRIYVPAGRGKTSFVDLRDIGDVAASTLLEPEKHRFAKYVLTGSQALDFYQVAEIMTKVLGRPITYSNPSSRQFKAYMTAKGLDPKYVNLVAGLHTFTKLGIAQGIKPDLSRILQRQPIPVEKYVEDFREVWEIQ